MPSVKRTGAGTAPKMPQLPTLHVVRWKPAYRYSSFADQLPVTAYSTPPPAAQPGSLPPPYGSAPVDGLILVKAPPNVPYSSAWSLGTPTRPRIVAIQLLAVAQPPIPIGMTAITTDVQGWVAVAPRKFCQSISP